MIKINIPDKNRIESLIQASVSDMEYTTSLQVKDKASNTIIRNIYECFRMIGEASLLKRGIKAQDHLICMDELIQLGKEENVQIIDWLRRIRHSINYQGYLAKAKEALEAKRIADMFFKKLVQKIIK